MRAMRPLALAALALAGLMAASAGAPARAAGGDAKDLLFDEARAFAYSQQAIGRTLGDHAFTDQSGRRVTLGAYRGQPLVVNLIFTACYQTCPLILQSLYRSVEVAQAALGADSFAVVTIGFDARNDTPERMLSYARQQGIDLPNWRFLSGDQAAIDKLTAELGFIAVPSPRGFDHLTQISLVASDGRVYRHVYGDDFTPPSVVEPLKRLVFGENLVFSNLTSWVNRVKLICTVYDPSSQRYRFSYAIFVGLFIGAASLVGVAAFIARAWWQSRPARGRVATVDGD